MDLFLCCLEKFWFIAVQTQLKLNFLFVTLQVNLLFHCTQIFLYFVYKFLTQHKKVLNDQVKKKKKIKRKCTKK